MSPKLSTPDATLIIVPKANGRLLERGTEVSIRSERGRFRFISINRGDGSGCFYGGPTGHEMYRDFPLARVRVVHAKKRTRANTTD